MKQLLTALALTVAFAGSAFAADAASAPAGKPMGSQQEKMKMCNKDATGKKGDERKAFMKDCLSKEHEAKAADAKADAKMNQQEKMKMCNKDATGKKGDERKAFMKECLSK